MFVPPVRQIPSLNVDHKRRRGSGDVKPGRSQNKHPLMGY